MHTKYGVYAGLGGLACAFMAPQVVPLILGLTLGVSAGGPVAGVGSLRQICGWLQVKPS